MKKILLLLLFICFVFNGFSQMKSLKIEKQEHELSEEQKEELRKKYNKDFIFADTKKKKATELKTTNSSEENSVNQDSKIKVKYYYGKKDSLYKKFEYTKPD